MKLRSAFSLVALIIIVDQVLKIWIKTSFPFGPVTKLAGQDWAQLYFIENPGMAWGMEIGGDWGKMALTLFRLVAVTFGSWYLVKIIKEKHTKGFIVCACLIYAGALGNLIDSMFYGLIFDETTYTHVASFVSPGNGYGSFLHGKVVDMLYFPMVEGKFPGFLPFLGGKDFLFFSPIFNIADASISVGVLTLLAFQKRFLHHHEEEKSHHEESKVQPEEAKPMA